MKHLAILTLLVFCVILMGMNGEHENSDFILRTLAVQKADLKGKELQHEYFARMRETTENANDIILKYTRNTATEINDKELQDFMLRITNRRTDEKPSLVASLVRNAYDCAAPDKDWRQHAELMAAAEMKANSYYFANWVYDDKFIKDSIDTKQSVNASVITKPLADRIILDWATKSDQHKEMLPAVMGLFTDSDIYTELGQRMDIFNNVYDKQKDKPLQDQITYAMKRTELLGEYYKNAARLGGLLANTPEDKAQALEQFGRNFAIAGQITNDITDYSVVQYATFAKQYKDAFSDFKNKKMTLPLIFALAQTTRQEKAALQDMLEQNTANLTDTDLKEVYDIMTNCGAFDTSKKYAVQHANFAKSALRKSFSKDDRRFLSQATIMPKNNKYYSNMD